LNLCKKLRKKENGLPLMQNIAFTGTRYVGGKLVKPGKDGNFRLVTSGWLLAHEGTGLTAFQQEQDYERPPLAPGARRCLLSHFSLRRGLGGLRKCVIHTFDRLWNHSLFLQLFHCVGWWHNGDRLVVHKWLATI
jgi:hypothetical protein